MRLTPLDMKPEGHNVQHLVSRIQHALKTSGVGMAQIQLRWHDESECFQLVTQMAAHVYVIQPLTDEQVERIDTNTASVVEEAVSFILNVLGSTGFMRLPFPNGNGDLDVKHA